MHRIALVLHDTAMLYEVAIASEIFGADRPTGSAKASGTTSWSAPLEAVPIRGYPMCAPRGSRRSPASTPSSCPRPTSSTTEWTRRCIAALHAAQRRGARLAALCTGAFVLAAAGVLDGRAAATHWMHAEDLARRYPRITVRPDVLYVDDGPAC